MGGYIIIQVVYRIEHSSTGLGPFQHGLSEKTRNLLQDYWSKIENVYAKYPPPTEDPKILENNNIPQNLIYKFACLKEEDIYNWLGNKVVNSLFKEGFMIKEYREGIDFQYVIIGTNQVVIFIE